MIYRDIEKAAKRKYRIKQKACSTEQAFCLLYVLAYLYQILVERILVAVINNLDELFQLGTDLFYVRLGLGVEEDFP